jgi:DNA-binding transcriptional MerR regulator
MSMATQRPRTSLDVFMIGEAASIVGVTPRRLRYWEQLGLLRPSLATPVPRQRGKPGRPRGTVDRLFTRDDLLGAILIHRLRSEGFSLQKVRRATDVLRARFGDEPLKQALKGRFRLVIGSSIVSVEDDERRAWDILRREQGVAMFSIPDQAKTIERLIADWRRSKEQERRLAEALVLARLPHSASRGRIRDEEARRTNAEFPAEVFEHARQSDGRAMWRKRVRRRRRVAMWK